MGRSNGWRQRLARSLVIRVRWVQLFQWRRVWLVRVVRGASGRTLKRRDWCILFPQRFFAIFGEHSRAHYFRRLFRSIRPREGLCFRALYYAICIYDKKLQIYISTLLLWLHNTIDHECTRTHTHTRRTLRREISLIIYCDRHLPKPCFWRYAFTVRMRECKKACFFLFSSYVRVGRTYTVHINTRNK